MNYLVCDMNCNNFGNFFDIICHERDIVIKENSYYKDNTYYPLSHCYIAKLPLYCTGFKYSEAIDYLLPKEYVRWMETRFGC